MAARSLGTLTLDLVAKTAGFVQGMDAAERKSAEWKKKVKKDLEDVSKKFAAIGVAAAAGLGALTIQTANAAKEIVRLSQVSNTSTDQFQRYAVGAKTVGVEQEKLADIFKDTTDKVGDFLQTGGGPLADFFENIAPQVGVTAEQFRNLSGPQALGLYVDSLEKANISQNEMTFFMEAIASDATLLYPLLSNNAEGFKLFSDQAERAGAILKGDTIEQAQRLNASLLLSELALKGAKNQLVSGFLPSLTDLSENMMTATINTDAFYDVGEAAGKALKFMATTGAGASAVFVLLTKSIGTLVKVAEAADIDFGDIFINPDNLLGGFKAIGKIRDNIGEVKKVLADGGAEIQESALNFADLINTLSIAGKEGGGEKNSAIDKIIEQQKKAKKLREEILSGTGSTFQSKEQDTSTQDAEDEARKKFEAVRDSLRSEEDAISESYEARRQIILDNTKESSEQQSRLLKRLSAERDDALANTSAQMIEESLLSEEDLIRLSYERHKDIILASTEKTEEEKNEIIKKLAEERDDALANTSAQRQMEMLNAQAEMIEESLLSEEDLIRLSYERRKDIILASTEKTEEEKNEIIKKLAAERDDAIAEQSGDVIGQRMAAQFRQGFDNILYDVFTGDIDDIGEEFSKLFTRIAADAAAKKITQALFGNFGSRQGGGTSTNLGGIIGGFLSSFDGGGFTGSGARVGGLDGKGGYMAMVHPNETVIDHTVVNRGNSSYTVNQNINVAPTYDNRTAHQIANESARKQRLAQARFSA